jgi:hypothetical protein
MSSFKAWFVVGILRFQKWFVVDVLGFQIELCCRYFGFFFTRPLFGLFLENLAIFSNLLVTLARADVSAFGQDGPQFLRLLIRHHDTQHKDIHHNDPPA